MDLRTETIIHSFNEGSRTTSYMNFSPDTRLLLKHSLGSSGVVSIHIVELWDVRTWTMINGPYVQFDIKVCARFCFGSRPNVVTSSHFDNEARTIQCWMADTGRSLVSLQDDIHRDVYALAGSLDGQQLITGDDSGNVNFWNLSNM